MKAVNTVIRIATAVVLVQLQLPSVRAEEAKPAGGISTPFGDVLIENLGIGRTYNLRELAGKPMTVTNKGSETIELLMEVTIPSADMITAKRKELGFKPIPDTKWVTLTKDRFMVPPGETAFTDLIITIPDDPALFGKKFQISIHSHSVSRGFLNLGVWSHFLLTFVESPEVQAKIEENRKRGIAATLDYRLNPDRIYIEKAPIGKKFEVRKELNKTIKIANAGEATANLTVDIVKVSETPLSLQAGFEEPANPNWLKVKSRKVRVKPDSFFDPGLVLELPNDPALHKKNLMFVLRIQPENTNEVGVTVYGTVYVVVD